MGVLPSMASGMKFDFKSGEIATNLARLDFEVHSAVTAIAGYHATVAEGELKVRAPWTDRTSAARVGLHTDLDVERAAWTIYLAHAVNYGIWLETRNDFNGRYAVILPVLIDTADRLMRSLEGLFGKM
jgi:hypothetical protein